ncbi:IS200/IS605 family transposase [Owenweeksia hongkongensis]|uniref:IS200/IS605 family transposase n=1 Tax=Owenweeksia hongkongensis TaxID=253245 RepID=UPI003A8FDFE5
MSWVRVWIHMVFSTKNREPFLTDGIRQKVFSHIMENAKKKEIRLAIVNGYTDHAHCLLALNKDITVAKAAQLIKGESAFWINKQGLTNQKFMWQDDYWAVSVGERDFKTVFDYIKNQEEHHRKKSFAEEYESMLKQWG